ncbi:MAG: nucleotidyltransferase domain-containing protein [Euryarchaeota archaeon]|nr:nucleotidyltransferase domain-containing protein [Euryarchaeota archaeon]
MRLEKLIETARRELAPLKEHARGVVLYGSVLTEHFMPGRSDIDVALVTMKREGNLEVFRRVLGLVNPERYDVRVFELLPLYLKAEVIRNYAVVFGDEGELGEYFYFWRKLCRHFELRDERASVESITEGRRRLERLRRGQA